MAKSILKSFDTNGSTLGVPISPNANPITAPSINVQGNSLLHNQYSNIGDPSLTNSPYTNMGAAATSYSLPSTSQLGESAQAYQGETNRYRNNLPEGSSL